jgi:hypothetical protein
MIEHVRNGLSDELTGSEQAKSICWGHAPKAINGLTRSCIRSASGVVTGSDGSLWREDEAHRLLA